jgi:hypothetical protein
MKAKKIMEEIQNKKEEYIKMYRQFPTKIEISTKYLIDLYLHILNFQLIPYEKFSKLFGMDIVINNEIKRIKDITVW